jgi:hypothetical protein
LKERKHFALKARSKLRDVKRTEQEEMAFGESFSHFMEKSKRDTIDYFEEKKEEEVKKTRKRSGSVWKAHERRKLRTWRRSTFGSVKLHSPQDFDRLVFNYELPSQKTLKRIIKKLE